MVIDAFDEAAAYCIPLLKTCKSSPVPQTKISQILTDLKDSQTGNS